jgi:nucleoside-diphosphate-sugar epimerase
MTLILVTGASGFVGSHVVDELLRQGYSVRGTVRSHNVARISKSYESFGDRFSTTVIDDIATSDLSQAVEGVDIIIHVASPLPNSSTPQAIIDVGDRTQIKFTFSNLQKLTLSRVPSPVPRVSLMPPSPPA